MQTFLPFELFGTTSFVLDTKRLNKQTIEAEQILTTLKEGGAYKNHPAVLQWEGYDYWLMKYALALCEENQRRRNAANSYFSWHKTIVHERLLTESKGSRYSYYWIEDSSRPPWLGNYWYHANHRARLCQKSPSHICYGGWLNDACDSRINIGNLWPVTKNHGNWVFMKDGKVVGRAEEIIEGFAG